jgi:acetyltransferase-like isoleucine patch superfamily enzyme
MKKLASSLLFIFCKVVSYLPFHFLRIGIYKIFFGARISFKAGLYYGVEIRHPWKLSIDESSIVGHGVMLDARKGLTIGKNVNISSDVMIWTLQHDYNSPTFDAVGSPVVIGDYVWVCSRAIILPGVSLGTGCVVASGAVVTRDVEAFTIVGGVPAKKIGVRSENLTYDLSSDINPII